MSFCGSFITTTTISVKITLVAHSQYLQCHLLICQPHRQLTFVCSLWSACHSPPSSAVTGILSAPFAPLRPISVCANESDLLAILSSPCTAQVVHSSSHCSSIPPVRPFWSVPPEEVPTDCTLSKNPNHSSLVLMEVALLSFAMLHHLKQPSNGFEMDPLSRMTITNGSR